MSEFDHLTPEAKRIVSMVITVLRMVLVDDVRKRVGALEDAHLKLERRVEALDGQA